MSLQNAPILAPGSMMGLSTPEVNYVAPQADLTLRSADKPVYQFVQQFANNVGSSVTINASSTTQAIFNLSGDVPWNFGRSYFTFQMNCTASTNVTSLSTDTIPIDNISLRTIGGTEIAVLFNVQPYSRVVPALTTDLVEYLSRGYVYGAATPALSFFTECKFLNPHNQLFSTAATTTVPTVQYVYGSVAAPSVAQGSSLSMAADSGTDKSYYGRQRNVWAGANGAGVALQTLCSIPFKAFVGTMLALDKDVIIGQNMQLVVNFSAANQFIWDTSAFAVTGAQTVIAYAGVVTFANLYLWLAKEINGNIVAGLRNKLNAGYEILIPYTYCGKNSTSSTGLYSAPQTLTTGMGECLKRIINIVANGTATQGLINDIDNVNGHKYTTAQSYLDANPIQYTQLRCGTDIQDWQYMYNFLKGTPAGLSVRDFQINSFFMDNFSSSLENGSMIRENDCVDDGLKLGDASKNYILQLTLTAGGPGANVYQYMTWVRRLIITPNSLHWGM